MGEGGGGEGGGGEPDGKLRRGMWATGAKEIFNWSHVPIGRLVLHQYCNATDTFDADSTHN